MFEINDHSPASIPEGVMLGRLAQSEQMREFFIQMWLQNPALAARTGCRMQDILCAGRRPASADFYEPCGG